MRTRYTVAIAVLIAGTLTSVTQAHAQTGTITGTAASDGGPVVNALVQVVNAQGKRGATVLSDPNGRFQLKLAAGIYDLLVSSAGYADQRVSSIAVRPGATTDVTVALTIQPFELDKVAVTALRRPGKLLDAPASITVVDQQSVHERPAVSPLDHVVGIAGVDVATHGIETRQIVTRGFNELFSSSLLLMTDNRYASVPVLRANYPWLLAVNDEDVDRIEVLLGPASVLYGPNSANGVLHIITKSPFDYPGTSVSVTGGERSLLQLMGRHAGIVTPRLAYKISGQYFRAQEWPAPPQQSEIVLRDPQVERASGEMRLDYHTSPTATTVFTVGSAQAIRNVEMQQVGTTQIKNWRVDYGQLRFSDRKFFAQVFVNANHTDNETVQLQTGQTLYDKSYLVAGQLQHGTELGKRSTLTYGIDLLRAEPRTKGTINGRNENDDSYSEVGGYVHGLTRLGSKLELVTALRVDKHSRLSDAVFSPSAALLLKPREGHTLRLTYNRAFNNPTATDLSLDVLAGKLDPLPYSIYGIGTPRNGLKFGRDCNNGLCMSSPFAPQARLPLDATTLWPAVVAVMKSIGVDLSGLPAPTKQDVRTDLRVLDAATASFRAVTPNDVRDIAPLKPTITSTIEAGYKGLLAEKVLFSTSIYYMKRKDFRGPLSVETPNAFLNTADLTAYLSKFMPAAQAQALAAGIAGIPGNAQAPGIPLGTVGFDDAVFGGSDIVLTYRNFGDIDLWGGEASVQVLLTPKLSWDAGLSFLSKNYYPKSEVGFSDLSLNAPKRRFTTGLTYRDAVSGLSANMRTRLASSFQMVSGVWAGPVDAYGVLDGSVSYRLPMNRKATVSLDAQNIFDDQHAEFYGAPVIGRLILVRLHYAL